MARSDQLARLFANPTSAAWRRYEICRAYFYEQKTAKEIALQFGLHVGSVQAIARDFAANPDPAGFFILKRPGRKSTPKRDAVIERAVELRQQGLSLKQIVMQLDKQGRSISPSYLAALLRREGFGRLDQRQPSSRPGQGARDDM